MFQHTRGSTQQFAFAAGTQQTGGLGYLKWKFTDLARGAPTGTGQTLA